MVNNVCTYLEPEIVTLVHNIIIIIKIAVPIALVIFGMIDFSKGVMAGKEDEVKKGQNTFIKRLIAGAVVFLMISLTQLVISVFDKDSNGQFLECANAIMNGDKNINEKYETQLDIKDYIKENERLDLICDFNNSQYNILDVRTEIESIANNLECDTAVEIISQDMIVIKEGYKVGQCLKNNEFPNHLPSLLEKYKCKINQYKPSED